MFIGGCAGSTTCGIKVFRFQVLYASARTQIHHFLQPHGVFIPYYNRRPISDDVITSVLSFFFMWFLAFSLLALGLGFLGLDFLTAFSSAATAIANVGPALGPYTGPAQTFQHLPDAAKWLLSFGMLLGRLELFTVIVLFTRSFWRGWNRFMGLRVCIFLQISPPYLDPHSESLLKCKVLRKWWEESRQPWHSNPPRWQF